MMKTPRMLAALVVTALFAIAGCGGGGDDSGGTPNAEKATQAKASGDVTWCIGKDTTGAFGTVVDNFNKANPKAKVKLIELPTSADDQRGWRSSACGRSRSECDVLGMDVIWTAEYAAQGWLKDVPTTSRRTATSSSSPPWTPRSYEGKNWAVPFNSNAGFIYYRTDKVSSAPKDWETLTRRPLTRRHRLSGLPLRGPDGDFLELLYSRAAASSPTTARRPRPTPRRSRTS